MSRFLVTGTDTAIGKTTVASALAAALARRGLDVGAMKPAETGCAPGPDGELVGADAEQLRYFAGSADPPAVVCPFRFAEPLAPSIAARRAGRRIELGELTAAVDRFTAAHAVALVEGAGGLLVPLTDGATFADLARACGLRLLVVVGNRLGALNHAQLTMRWAEAAGVDTLGYVVNTLQREEDLAAQTNREMLAELLGPPLGVLPWLGPIACTPADRERLAGVAERSLRIDALLDAARARAG